MKNVIISTQRVKAQIDSRKSALQDRRIGREGFALKERAKEYRLPKRWAERVARKEKNDEKREKRKGEKRME